MSGIDPKLVDGFRLACEDAGGVFEKKTGALGVEEMFCHLDTDKGTVRIQLSKYRDENYYVSVGYVAPSGAKNDVDLDFHDYFSICSVRDIASHSKGTKGKMLICRGENNKMVELSIEEGGDLINIISNGTLTGHIYRR